MKVVFRVHWLALGVSLMSAYSSAATLDTVLNTELAYGTEQREINKAESVLSLQWQGDLPLQAAYSLLARVAGDAADDLRVADPADGNYSSFNGPIWESEHGDVEIAEAYVDFSALNGWWRVGKQQVVWGQADGLKVLDVVNPQNFREFNLPEFEDSRIATWMLNAEFELPSDATLQVLLIPDTTYHKLADNGTTYEFTSPRYIPAVPPGVANVQVASPDRPDHYTELGLRYRQFVSGWDWALNYLKHFQDVPVLYREVDGSSMTILPAYERNELFGTTASTALGDYVIRLELGYNTDTYHLTDNDLVNRGIGTSPEIASVVGLDYLGFQDWLISFQWFQSTLTDDSNTFLREETRMQTTLMLQRTLWNETLELELFMLFSDEDQDGQVRAKATYLLADGIRIWLGADAFYGANIGQFGQFDDTDRIVMGLEWGNSF